MLGHAGVKSRSSWLLGAFTGVAVLAALLMRPLLIA
jgi:hypothetical protein